VSEALMFISRFINGLVAQSELSQLLDELFGSLDQVSQNETGEARPRLAIAS
jgi:hypothetical protein